jgi:hypothetical protein
VESVFCFPSSLWESASCADFHSCGTFHSLFRPQFAFWPLRIKVRHGVWAVANAQSSIQMLINRHAAAGQGRTKPCGGHLKYTTAELDRVVSGNNAFVLNREDAIQI